MGATRDVGVKVVATARTILGRIGRGARLIARRRPDRTRIHSPALERPSFVLATGLVAALAAIALLDPLLRKHPGIPDGSVLDTVLTALTSFGEGVEILIGAAALLLAVAAVDPAGLARRLRARLVAVGAMAGFAFASVAGSGLLASLIKNLYGRVRPEHLAGDGVFELHGLAFRAKYAAFPSGHATTAGATAMVLALIFPRWRGPILVAGVVVALTRVALGAHFFSDVAAGFALGACVTLVIAHRLALRGVAFRPLADGRLVPRTAAGPAGWFDLLAGLLAARRG